MRKTVNIIVPLYNEQECFPELSSRIRDVLDEISADGMTATVMFVNDGSSDGTAGLIRGLHGKDRRFGYVELSRNFGHQAAIYAGLDNSESDSVVVLDGDLQDPPEIIPDMLKIWKEDKAEVVYAVRKRREGNLLKKFCYYLFYRLFNAVANLKIPMDTGDFAVMDKCIYKKIAGMPEKVVFLRAIRAWLGFRQVGYEYDRPDRKNGTAKYNFLSLYKLATDGLASFSVAPLQFAQVLAFIFMAFGVWAAIGSSRMSGTLFLPVFICISIALIFFCIYILGAYVGRIYYEIKHRPLYVAATVVQGVPREAGRSDKG
jgi:dolichol-phosphate mannosyltransferase